MRRKTFINIFGLTVLTLMTTACSPQLTANSYIHEAGETLSEEVSIYATFKNPEKAAEATLDLSNVAADKVGTYEAIITYKNKEYPVNVDVVDTTSPHNKVNSAIADCGIDEVITVADFECETTDISEFDYGLRNATLIINEEALRESILASFKKADEEGSETVSYSEMTGITLNEEGSTWDEADLSVENMDKEFIPEETGLYRIELCCADEYGNADITYVYVMADLEAPVLVAEDKEIKVTSDLEKYMNSLNEGISAEDNLMGDLTPYITITNTELADSSSSGLKMTISYEVYDFAGNKTEGKRNITAKVNTVATSQGSASSGSGVSENQANGFDRSKAEQAFAAVNQQRAAAGLHELVWDEGMYNTSCNRAAEIVNDFSHNGCPAEYGENIAENYRSINNLINAWMNSSGHRKNILNSSYTAGAMGCYYYNGTYYWVNNFRY